MSNSLINITRFNAALYKDDMTLAFDLEGYASTSGHGVIHELFFLPLWGDIESTWTNYAHAPSAFAAFAIIHHIHFSGMSLMLDAIDKIVGGNKGNITRFGSSTPESLSPTVEFLQFTQGFFTRTVDTTAPSPAEWHGTLSKPGFPLPGNHAGFSGPLTMANIPASNAPMTGLLCFWH
ncbi:hypothetical protein CISG_04748 [Coccidioides immitis RMSCC 3703]|uniref:Uncharacterized protein n=2 Tax=Coccidioides immitis TaxID=5501 RepID=A0A0J8QRK1_COCIT|nr:hypothetical protein CIRG_09562 [Coccidioides immitis RMSCC 2394]KMU75329.1 hypothetical protein CISG_04748 [Coccidioides immitis RMSCC 3703]